MQKRLLSKQIAADLSKKMVLLSGPRQSGKTTLARAMLPGGKRAAETRYLNWDDDESRTRILQGAFPHQGMIVFDELHKYGRWRNLVKGLYDREHGGGGEGLQILVTGSARLDLYRRGGDSLQGRYHHLRLYPLSLKEADCQLKDLLALGPFPEPLLGGSLVEAKRWSRQYRSRLVREDVADLERVTEMGAIESLSIRLPALIGSPLSLNGLREDLQVAHKTVERWLDIFERLMFIFRLDPFGPPRIKAVKKSRKHYLFEWLAIEDEGARFENLVAFHLLKECHYLEDTEGRDMELRFFRDVEGREVDFVQLEDKKPIRFVECKLSDTTISPALLYLRRKFPQVPALQVIAKSNVDRIGQEGVRLVSADRFLAELAI
ncbi:MAG: ATP-binding protein [Aeromicrobium sp.]|nr:ATP-binding protein [Burkholderiales bacterium]